MTWKSTLAELPEEGQDVLTWRNGVYHIMYLRNDVWYYSLYGSTYGALSAIPYWMPLPDHPLKKEAR